MRLRSIPLLALLGAVLLASTGCNPIGSILPSPNVNHVKVSAKVASPSATVQGKLKSGAPSNLPLWDGAGVTHTKVVKSDLGDSWSVTLRTGDAFSDVVAGMATGFQNAGWRVEKQDVSSAESSVTVFAVSDKDSQGVVTITGEKNGTTQIDYVMTVSK